MRSNPERRAFPSKVRAPVQLSTLVGRRRELEELRSLVDERRLISLVGAGGSGKTRLASAVADAVELRGACSVAWIDLTTLHEPDVLPEHLAGSLGLREQVGTDPVEALCELLDTSPTLLVLDNCEHLVGVAARVVEALLRGAPSLRILTTSRQALGVTGEKVWPVPPLDLPDPDTPDPSASSAVQLFVERAQDVQPGFALSEENASAVARICRRLDGLPLAIELAAARVRLLPPDQLASRLDTTLSLVSSPAHATLPRHRTLRALIDWSCRLLAPEERTLLERLSIFVGGFTLDAAEAVGGYAPLQPGDVLEVLAALVDRSLVGVEERRGEARYVLLETIRRHARDLLAEAGGLDEARERHARYYVTVAETAEPYILGGTRGTAWMARLEREHGNLRAASEWAAETDDRVTVELRLSAALHWFHFGLGQFGEPRRRLERALATDVELPAGVRGRALASQGFLAFWMGDPSAALAPLASAVPLLRGAGESVDLSFALTGLATVSGLAGDPEAALPLFDEAQAVLGDSDRFGPEDFPRALLHAFASYWRGTVLQLRGDLPGARACYETAVGVGRRFGSHPTVAHPLTALARTLVLLGEPDAARAHLAEALPLFVAQEDRWGLLQAIDVGVMLASAEGRPESAGGLLGAADSIRASLGVGLAPHEQEARARHLAELRDALGSEALERARTLGAGLSATAIAASIVGGQPPARAPASEGVRRDRVGPTPEPDPPARESAPLRVRALGPLEIDADGRPVGEDAFVSGKPRELLLLLLCNPDGLTREQVGLAFWPEASGAQVKNSFHVTLHRLRKALGHPDWIVAADDRYRVAPQLVVDFDAPRFDSEVERLLSAPLDEDSIRALEAALALYRGDFLEGTPVGDWHLEIRERLRRRCIRAWMALGEYRAGEGRDGAAADAFRAVLTRDRVHEEACRRLMTSLARTGDRLEALRLYETHRALLREELGTLPDAGTTALYDELRGLAT